MMREAARIGLPQWLGVSLLALVVYGLDQGTKALVQAAMVPGQSIPPSGLVRITYTINMGIAFGLFRDQGFLLPVASVVGIGVLMYYFRRYPLPGFWPLVSLGLMLGGAVGNLTDRFRLGYVVDFIDLGPWPVFNVADSSIVVGVLLLAWVIYRPRGVGAGGGPTATRNGVARKGGPAP